MLEKVATYQVNEGEKECMILMHTALPRMEEAHLSSIREHFLTGHPLAHCTEMLRNRVKEAKEL
jgi:hypothetical protein